ncbi:MAG TPA: glycosyltransferase family 39 protein, partial [Sulfuricurvum sp.]|nr:glycosyltransferase family 39 protein [Sulfuricurvum sp.]
MILQYPPVGKDITAQKQSSLESSPIAGHRHTFYSWANYSYNSPMNTYSGSALLIILVSGIFAAIYNAYLPLHGDEAYYWLWSHHLQSGYYDHPPMIAFLIALSNYISEAEWSVRLINIAAMSVAGWVIFRLLEAIRDAKTALWGVIIFESVVLVHAGYTIVTTDSPLILFWALSLYATYRVLTRAKTADFILMGLFVGAMMLSKYTAILYVIAPLLFLLLRRRDLYADKRTYLAMVLALLVISPLLWWNYHHDWISFLFQLHHGGGKEQIMWNWFTELIGAQFGVFTPVFAAILFYFLLKERLFWKNEILFFFAVMTVTPLLFFLYKSLHTHIELNYTAPAYISGTVLTAYVLAEKQMKRTFFAGVTVALLLSLSARAGLLFWLPVVQDRMYGNKEAVAMLQRHRKPQDALYANHLTMAALITYYAPDHHAVRIPTPTRYSQYDMW